MKTHAIVFHDETSAHPIELRERELAAPGAGEALIAMEAAGVSFAEVQMLRGRYPGQPRFPFVPGYDLVGTVLSVGPGVDGALVGKRVATMTTTGAWAEHVLRPARELVVVSDSLDPAEVETLIVNGLTAYKMLHRVARVRRGQTIVVHGAGGGVGTMLVQLARIADVEVIGTGRPAQRAEIEGMGARFVDYKRGAVPEDVRALAPNGVDAVFDHVGGDSLRSSFAMLRAGGTVVSYGNASAARDTGSAWSPIVRTMWLAFWWSLRARGRSMKTFDVWGRGSFGADHALRPARFWREFRSDLEKLVELLASGRLHARVAERVPLARAAEALAKHATGSFVGKIILHANDPARPPAEA